MTTQRRFQFAKIVFSVVFGRRCEEQSRKCYVDLISTSVRRFISVEKLLIFERINGFPPSEIQ